MKNCILLIIVILLFSGCPLTQEINPEDSPEPEPEYNTWLMADTDEITPPVSAARTGADDWRDEIIYFLMTDRFYDGDPSNNVTGSKLFSKTNPAFYHGGDLKGIMDNAEYLKKLGITAVWITPIGSQVKSVGEYPGNYTGFHGYCSNDLSVIDPSLTSSANQNDPEERKEYYRQFIETMHNNGILVIQDAVVNHMGEMLKYVKTAPNGGWGPPFNPEGYDRVFLEDEYDLNVHQWIIEEGKLKPAKAPFNQLSAYNGYGLTTNWENEEEVIKGDMSGICDLNTQNEDVQNALIQIYQDWVSLGVDGFRLDTARHVEETFWDFFPGQMRLNAGGKKFLQFGEVSINHHEKTKKYTMDASGNPRLDSLLNFELYDKMIRVFAQGYKTSLLTDELTNRSVLRNTAVTDGGGVDAFYGAVNFIDNHDVTRFVTSAGGNVHKMRNALIYLLTTAGIPCIFYNTENDIKGDRDQGRKDMPDFNTAGKKTLSLINRLIKIRKDNPALRRGTITVLKDSQTSGIFSFVRSTGVPGETILVIINTSRNPITLPIPVVKDSQIYFDNNTVLTNILYKEFGIEETLSVQDGSVPAEIEGLSAKIYRIQ